MITVAGLAPSLDLTYLVDSISLGTIHRPTGVVRVPGGKPLNLARAAARLGADVAVVALLGGATGRTLADQLAVEGLPVMPVWTTAETRTCVSVAAADQGDLTEVYEYAPAVSERARTDFTAALSLALSDRPGWLAIAGGAPLAATTTDGTIAVDKDIVTTLVDLGLAAGVRVALDSHGPALAHALDRPPGQGPALVKVNRYEVAELLGRPADDDLVDMGRTLQDRTGALVILTDGRDGAVAVLPSGGALRVGPANVVGRYPVGSGDAFLGGLLTVLDQVPADGPPAPELVADALRTATAAGAANAAVPGPGIFDLDLVAELAARVALTSA